MPQEDSYRLVNRGNDEFSPTLKDRLKRTHTKTQALCLIGLVFLISMLTFFSAQSSSDDNVPLRHSAFKQSRENGVFADYMTQAETNEVVRKLGKDIHALRLVSVKKEKLSKSPRIFCWVNTYDKNHKTRAKAIKETWGKKCDKLVFMSNKEDSSLPAVRVTAPATHEALWLKHTGVLKIIYREYYGEYDWFFKCDDDTFVIMENLKAYLQSEDIRSRPKHEPLLLGHRMTLPWWELQRPFTPFSDQKKEFLDAMLSVRDKYPKGMHYTPGGGGYLLNWAYIKKITESLDMDRCLPGKLVPDDWAISFCMQFHGVFPIDTRDELKRERFHQYSPKKVFYEKHDENAFNHAVYKNIYQESNWFSDHNGLGWQNGTMCCAPDSISFHYIKEDKQRLLEKYFYKGGIEQDRFHTSHE